MDEKWIVDEWTGCYPSNWKGLIVRDAMSHPAKFSSRLIRRIYEHMQEEGWIKEQAWEGCCVVWWALFWRGARAEFLLFPAVREVWKSKARALFSLGMRRER